MVPHTVALLRCPQCGGRLSPAPDAGMTSRLDCDACPLGYPVRDGVPVLVIGEATARPIRTDPEFDRLVAEAVAAPFSGWDFSWLGDRRRSPPDPRGAPHD